MSKDCNNCGVLCVCVNCGKYPNELTDKRITLLEQELKKADVIINWVVSPEEGICDLGLEKLALDWLAERKIDLTGGNDDNV